VFGIEIPEVNVALETLVQWIKVFALVWAGALVVAFAAQIRWLQRFVPDWLRNVSRIVVLAGAVGALTMAVLLGGRMMIDAIEARPDIAEGPALDIDLSSLDAAMLSLYLSMHQAELNQSASDDDSPVTFVVESGETAGLVAMRLEEEGLVVDGEVFRRFMTYHQLDSTLQAGTYSLRANMTMHEIAEVMQAGASNATRITIPEGWRLEQIAFWLEYQGVMRGDDFLAEARSAQYAYPWLAGRPPDASLEGFLFPDTYELGPDVTPKEVVDMFVANFDARAGAVIAEQLPGKVIFDINLGDYRPMTAYDIVTLASIVEREAVVDEERPIIASVYYNRLDPAYVEETALRLSSDPTIQYAKGYDPETDSWWNPMEPGEGQTLESPYNTFKVQGLPPGPISNPGLASILAVLNPADTTYLYFHALGDGSGTHVFASTLEEHLANQEKYQP
jgi:UPF0755 protein